MKTTTIRQFIIASMFGALAATGAGAQDEPRPPRPEGGRGAGGGGGLMRALDANADGKLDQSEIDMAVAALRKLDKDGDGTVSGSELGAGGGGRPGGPRPEGGREGRPRLGPEMFERIDGDGDGKISKEEAPDRMKERFADIDTDGDGFLDKKEQEALLENLRKRFGQGGPPRPGQNPGGRRGGDDAGAGGTEKPKRPPVEK